MIYRIFRAIAGRIAKTMIHPREVSKGSFGQYPYQYSVFDFSKKVVSQVVITLPSDPGGWVQIIPARDQEPIWDNSRKLESVVFNDRVKVFTSNKLLAYKVLAPDFMAWLLDLPVMPQIYLLDQKCFVALVDSQLSNDEHLDVAEKVLKFILHSGALEKAEPLFPHL